MAPAFKLRIRNSLCKRDRGASEYYLSREGASLVNAGKRRSDEALRSRLKFPERGAPVDIMLTSVSLSPSHSVPGFPNHSIYYMVAGEGLRLLHVLHGARRPEVRTSLAAEDES